MGTHHSGSTRQAHGTGGVGRSGTRWSSRWKVLAIPLAVVLVVFTTILWGARRADAAGLVTVPPSAVGQANGNVNVYWDEDNTCMVQMSYTTVHGWIAGQYPPAVDVGPPSAIATGGGDLEVFFEDYTSGNLFHAVYPANNPGFGGSLGMGRLGGAPHAVSSQPHVIDVFWRGQDNGLWHAWYAPPPGSTIGQWWGPQELAPAGSLASDPYPVTSESGVIDVFWKGTDGNLWHVWYVGGWYAPQNLGGGPLAGDPIPVSYAPGQIKVLWRGMDGNLWSDDYSGSWQSPTFTGGTGVQLNPAAISAQTGEVEVFWKGLNSFAQELSWSGGTWAEQAQLPSGPIESAPGASVSKPQTIDVFWVGQDDGLWHDWGYTTGWAGPQQLTVDPKYVPVC